jgi:hypothetical protein
VTTLSSIFRELTERDKQFTVYRSGEQTGVEAQFRNYSVEINHEQLPPGAPDPFLVIEENGTFVGALPVEALDGLLEPPVSRPDDPGEVSAGYRILFDVLNETVFHSMDRETLLAVSREVEDRALRVGSGTFSVTFQRLSAFKTQVDLYQQLATETDLDIHIYGLDDWTPPTIAGVTYHDLDDSAQQYWILAFDGGSAHTQACGLLARMEPDGNDGVWTDDRAIVERLLAALEKQG